MLEYLILQHVYKNQPKLPITFRVIIEKMFCLVLESKQNRAEEFFHDNITDMKIQQARAV